MLLLKIVSLIVFSVKLLRVNGAVISFHASEPAKFCERSECKLPDCWCSGTDIPGGLPSDEVPQMIMMSFDDAVNSENYHFYQALFNGTLKNPNGCNGTATFFVSHEYTEYQMVQAMEHYRNEIADHSISHRVPASWWKSANYSELNEEIAGQREVLRKWGQIEEDRVKGYRTPFLQIAGNTMFQVLYDNKFLYDSSMPTQQFIDPPLWPYTLDYRSTQDCIIPPCPTNSFPGLWEVPMVDYEDLQGNPCNMIDGCYPPANEDEVVELLNKNFERHYNSNRAPFPMFMHAFWFAKLPYALNGTIRFLQERLAQNDVWMVTIQQVIEWIKSPTSLKDIDNFNPWKCDFQPPPPPCNPVNVCHYTTPTEHYFFTCTRPCPHNYPWVGNPDGN